MSTTSASIRARFPDVFPAGAEMDAVLDASISEATARVSATALGARSDTGILYLAADLAYLNASASSIALLSGATQYSAGKVSMSWGGGGAGGSAAVTGFRALYNDLLEGTVPSLLVI